MGVNEKLNGGFINGCVICWVCNIKPYLLLSILILVKESWFPNKFNFLIFFEEDELNSVIVSSVIDFFLVIVFLNNNSFISPLKLASPKLFSS